MSKFLIKNGTLVNEGSRKYADILIENELISEIAPADSLEADAHTQVIDATGKFVIPGMIDDQVHFREPGLTHKAEIATESAAAVAGGITTYMEMPNTVPQALTQDLLQRKYDRAAEVSLANYSFFMGASNDNLLEVLKTDPKTVCGIKVFMGSSTGNMLVDKEEVLERIFCESSMLVATHCEEESIVRRNTAIYKEKYGENVPIVAHPLIRSEEACYASSAKAVELATKCDARLHILHISTAKELELFRNDIPLLEKNITAEACIHHLWFTDAQYDTKGTFIKWNPAVKSMSDRDAIREAVTSGKIDVIATDHAPHTLQEKINSYFNAPSGGPLVQHALPVLFQMMDEGIFSMETIVHKTSHALAECFQIENRGYLREGYYADIAIINPEGKLTIDKSNILYKCGWSPFEGQTFKYAVDSTFVSGHLAWHDGKLNKEKSGLRLSFAR
ncbi:MAG: dihydroorotase [Flavobacteriales bacterium]